MRKKTKASKHAARARSRKKFRPNPHKNSAHPLRGSLNYVDLNGEAFDQVLLLLLKMTGIRDALLTATLKTQASEPDDKPTTVN